MPPPPAPGSDAPATEQLVVDGWGFAFLNPTSVQADNGAGLTQGIIGLANHGKRRKPDDWGALRAWAWGASRALDYLATDKAVDAKKVGIEGVSRYGKAALVTMAFDPRFAMTRRPPMRPVSVAVTVHVTFGTRAGMRPYTSRSNPSMISRRRRCHIRAFVTRRPSFMRSTSGSDVNGLASVES